MGVDRAGAGADDPHEAAEEPPPPDHRPPPDRPGSEGAPSRADSRNGAAAANETSTQAAENQGEGKPDTAQASQESPEREDNTTLENEPETPGTSKSNEGSSNDDRSGEQYDNNPTPEVEGQPESTDKPRPDQPDRPLPAADTSTDAEQGGEQVPDHSARITDRSGEALEGEEAAANTDDASSGGAETLARQLKSLDEADLRATDEGPGDVTGTLDEEQGSGVEVTPQVDSTSERTEPTWVTGGPDIAGDLPTGEELVKLENDKQSRAERARRKIYESGDEVLDDVGKVVNRVDQIFERPPTGHPETRTVPEVVPAPHDGINAADTATALIAAGVVVGEILRRGRERLKQKKGV
jgi:hypothetical protein